MTNAFVVVNCKTRKPTLVTLSARKARSVCEKGVRIEVWSNDSMIEAIYSSEVEKFKPYVQQEKEFIGMKQRKAEERNRKRRNLQR